MPNNIAVKRIIANPIHSIVVPQPFPFFFGFSGVGSGAGSYSGCTYADCGAGFVRALKKMPIFGKTNENAVSFYTCELFSDIQIPSSF